MQSFFGKVFPGGKGKMVTSVDLMKCACDKCLCIIRVENAINKDGKYYCSKACAEGHKTITGCAQTGCGCS